MIVRCSLMNVLIFRPRLWLPAILATVDTTTAELALKSALVPHHLATFAAPATNSLATQSASFQPEPLAEASAVKSLNTISLELLHPRVPLPLLLLDNTASADRQDRKPTHVFQLRIITDRVIHSMPLILAAPDHASTSTVSEGTGALLAVETPHQPTLLHRHQTISSLASLERTRLSLKRREQLP